ncbi:MAG: hypothetical protein RLZZ612_1644 [Pseudomonadota bacterium]
MNNAPDFPPMPTHLAVAVGGVALLAALSGMAHASPPAEKIMCTEAPRSQWMSEQQARMMFKASSYALVRFKVSKGNCHEFYAVAANGDVVEAYLHPVTGAVVRETRLPAPQAISSVSSSTTGVRP